jgi:hypothetical protein
MEQFISFIKVFHYLNKKSRKKMVMGDKSTIYIYLDVIEIASFKKF